MMCHDDQGSHHGRCEEGSVEVALHARAQGTAVQRNQGSVCLLLRTYYKAVRPPGELVSDGQTSPHKPGFVVSYSTCPPLTILREQFYTIEEVLQVNESQKVVFCSSDCQCDPCFAGRYIRSHLLEATALQRICD